MLDEVLIPVFGRTHDPPILNGKIINKLLSGVAIDEVCLQTALHHKIFIPDGIAFLYQGRMLFSILCTHKANIMQKLGVSNIIELSKLVQTF